MISCPNCGETSEDQFDSCWKCGTALRGDDGKVINVVPSPLPMIVKRRIFRGTFTSWETLLSEAADFATRVGKDRLITISHSEDENDGVVVVWYWSDRLQEEEEQAAEPSGADQLATALESKSEGKEKHKPESMGVPSSG